MGDEEGLCISDLTVFSLVLLFVSEELESLSLSLLSESLSSLLLPLEDVECEGWRTFLLNRGAKSYYHLKSTVGLWPPPRALGAVFKYQLITNPLNPSPPRSAKNQNSKIPYFILKNIEKQMVPCKSTAKEVSFEWSHHRISSTDSKVRTTLHMSL